MQEAQYEKKANRASPMRVDRDYAMLKKEKPGDKKEAETKKT